MMTSPPRSGSTGASGQGSRITASLLQPGRNEFRLVYRGETVSLIDSGSLNRWAAVGIVDRHKIAMLSDGISIDGRKILYTDPNATADLENMLNRPEAARPRPSPISAHSPAQVQKAPSVSEANAMASLADSVRVTRDGFEFHVTFKTRFGENKTERLAEALETFQNMRIFKPHINLQKSGIRLVVTRWDGDSFVEQPGIENLEHVSPEQVETLIRANLLGAPDAVTAAAAAHAQAVQRRVIRIEVSKKPHEPRFHLIYWKADGNSEEGLMLIRANMAKLATAGLFQPGVSISVSAMNDRVTIDRAKQPGEDSAAGSEVFPLTSLEAAKTLEAALNACLRTDEKPVPPPLCLDQPAPVEPAPPAPSAELVAPPVLETAPAPEKAPVVATVPEAPSPSAEAVAQQPLALPVAQDNLESKPTPTARPWIRSALQAVETISAEQVNEGVFQALRQRYDQPFRENDHGFPEFDLECRTSGGGSVPVRLVLAPHYLLCHYPFGYLRFGAETRVFLTRLDDYIVFQKHALRGVAESETPSGICFVVEEPFFAFVHGQSDRNFRTQFAEVVLGINQLGSQQDLIWPPSPEEQLFQTLSQTARSYGLPVTAETIVLDPSASEFVGFKRVQPHAMEFREGEEFVRFTPDEVDLSEEGIERRIKASGVLRGWALDKEGRVSVLYRSSSGFVPPAQSQLLRFVSEDERQREADMLNVLAELPN
jgi:hypothetical protein